MIYIDADENLTTWRHIMQVGRWRHYQGNANRNDTVIRWGANHNRWNYPNGIRILNRNLVLSKIEQAQRLVTAHVSYPQIFNRRQDWVNAGSPRVVTKPAIGEMGTGMRLSDNPTWTNERLVQLYIPKQREFRAMMVGDLIAFFMEKHPPENGDFRWNEHRGARWSTVPENRELRRRVKDLGKRALEALGYDFGAVDIIMHNNTLYVLEVNSRPEFGEGNAQRFVNAVQLYLERQPRQEPERPRQPRQEMCPHCGQPMPRR